jgi:short-subunit dehydrogenase
MDKRQSLWVALGAGLAFYKVWNMRQHANNAQRWETRRANQPSAGTAFITGASSGIGEAFARALARDGYNIVLAARREDRLHALAEKLQRGNPVRVETLVVDLSEPSGIERAASVLEELPDLEILVNNAGFGMHGAFTEIDSGVHASMIRLHVEAPVRLAHAAIPGMKARHQGGIINVASIAGLTALPGSSTYGSTKAYLMFFSKVLQRELAGTGVRVQALVPGFTYSEFHDVAHVSRSAIPSFMWMPAHKVVSASLEGLREDRKIVIPGRIYRLIALGLRLPGADLLAQMAQEWRLAQQEPPAKV